MSQWDTVIHLIAGGIAGTVGAVVTCPLEVVKTRLQSSSSGFNSSGTQSVKSGNYNNSTRLANSQHNRRLCTGKYLRYSFIALSHCGVVSSSNRNPRNLHSSPGLVQCLRYIIRNEGPKALFKGLGPNLIGVAPSRAIYFCTYSQSKAFLNTCLPPDSPVVHMCSAFCAGFVASTATNPIWFVKTRLQLDQQTKHTSAIECIQKIYRKSGILGFYKGIVASYMGISETVVHFVIYEAVKAWLITHRTNIDSTVDNNSKTSRDFLEFMAAGAFSKTVASCVAYPHEVARTRLREEGNKYRSFWQTLITVYNEEGTKGLYRGLSIQLVRQIPNTAIMMASYEAVVYILMRQFHSSVPPTSKSSNQFYTETKNKGELA